MAGNSLAVRRFLRGLEPRPVRATERLELEPDAEAQVDFGAAGLLLDPEPDL